MEQYYFIQQNGIKKGPYKLNELISQNVFFDELVWRSDDVKWKKASEFEELEGIYLNKPPLTPLEFEKTQINKEFLHKILPNLSGIYFVVFLIIAISSSIIANNSWQQVSEQYIINKDDIGKNARTSIDDILINDKQNQIDEDSRKLRGLRQKVKNPAIILGNIKNEIEFFEDDSIRLTNEVSNMKLEQIMLSTNSSEDDLIKPIYNIPENIASQEEANSYNQPFLIRPLYAYLSNIYLTREEQSSSKKLFINITLSSFSLLFVSLLINLIILYFIKMIKTIN